MSSEANDNVLNELKELEDALEVAMRMASDYPSSNSFDMIQEQLKKLEAVIETNNEEVSLEEKLKITQEQMKITQEHLMKITQEVLTKRQE